MHYVDTHCHIHAADYTLEADDVLQRSRAAGVDRVICVGTDERDSALAVTFVQNRPNTWAAIGLHPHDAKLGEEAFAALRDLVDMPKVVAIGECGLDYFYNHSSKEDQERALHEQMQLALEHDLPMIFHVREAFDDFWSIFDSYEGLRGVVHSFTATVADLEQVLVRGLYVGLNGIMTFTRDEGQLAAARAIPLDRMLLETDAPFLTPKPHRGKVNETKNIALIAEFLAELRGEPAEDLARQTTQNAIELFNLSQR